MHSEDSSQSEASARP